MLASDYRISWPCAPRFFSLDYCNLLEAFGGRCDLIIKGLLVSGLVFSFLDAFLVVLATVIAMS